MENFTENLKRVRPLRCFRQGSILALILFACFSVSGQRVAVVTPRPEPADTDFSEKLEYVLAKRLKIINSAVAESAFGSFGFENTLNLSTEEAKTAGSAIGCDFFIIVSRRNQRRYSFERKEYFEAYAALYAVSARTGRLVYWKLNSVSAVDDKSADKLLIETAPETGAEIVAKLTQIFRDELNERKPAIPELPDENSPEAKKFRPPVPYKRIPPPYTRNANLYGITATVDIEVDFDAEGRVTRTEILRWAGYGLDESVDQTVRKMNWRPAFANGKAAPVRVLLRYNFKKLEKEDPEEP